MSVLVTGGAGYIGSHMVLALLEKGEKVIVADDLTLGNRWSVPDEVEFVLCDIGHKSSVSRILDKYDVDTIIHFAASIVVSESVSNPLKYYKNNTSKTRNIAECAVEYGVKNFIFSSTAAVYGDSCGEVIVESSQLKPQSPYGKSKLMSEWILSDISNAYNLPLVILRYFNVAGADPLLRIGQASRESTHLIKCAVRASLGITDELCIYGNNYSTMDGTCVRDYIHVSDLVGAHLKSLEYLRSGEKNLICNVGYQVGYSVLDVIRTVKKISSSNFKIRLCPRRNGDVASIIASNDLVKSALGWEPKHNDLECIVRDAYNWEKKLNNNNFSSQWITTKKKNPIKNFGKPEFNDQWIHGDKDDSEKLDNANYR